MLWIRENSLFFSKLLISEAKTKVVDWKDQPIPLKTLDIRVPEPNLKFGLVGLACSFHNSRYQRQT